MDRIIDYLSYHASLAPYKTAFIISGKGLEPDQHVSYGDLEKQVRYRARQLAGYDLRAERAILVYQDPLSFIISFLGCQYAGIVPVPAPYIHGSRQFGKLQHIIDDAAPSAIICREASARHLQPVKQRIIPTDELCTDDVQFLPDTQEIAFIQYTSGSTSNPKGIVVTHSNLIHNQHLLRNTFNCDDRSVIFSWLPFHHDMGLIGNILHTIFIGCTCVLMPAAGFIQQPMHWLEGISAYKATHSGGPNFAYDLCVEKIPTEKIDTIDLSSWKVAYNGSELIRPSTLKRFAGYFAGAGFDSNAFCSCYGLAEATLLVAARKREAGAVVIHEDKQLVSAGEVAAGMELEIVSTETGLCCKEGEEGEICIAGNSVTSGYWKRDDTGLFYELNGKRFLRTGDLGFMEKGQLFVHGRLKEMMIVRGKNIYPTDIEQAIAATNNAIESNGTAVLAIDDLQEQILVIVEIKRANVRNIDSGNIINSIEGLVSGRYGIVLYDIILTPPFSIPRTTSGKLQRGKCREWYRDGTFKMLASKRRLPVKNNRKEANGLYLRKVMENPGYDHLRDYLLHLIEIKTGFPTGKKGIEHAELTDFGLDSLQLMELINTINKDLEISISAAAILENSTISSFTGLLENILWLKSRENSNNEVII